MLFLQRLVCCATTASYLCAQMSINICAVSFIHVESVACSLFCHTPSRSLHHHLPPTFTPVISYFACVLAPLPRPPSSQPRAGTVRLQISQSALLCRFFFPSLARYTLCPTFPPDLAVKSLTGELNVRALHTDILSLTFQ